MKLSEVLGLLADDPDHPVDLARVALLIARDAYSHLHPRAYLRRIDRLAEQLQPRLRGTLASRTAELSTFLFDEYGFAGNTQHYYDPRNSYLNKVLDRQVGLPISLSLVAMAVGTRAGLPVVGVSLAGPLRREGGGAEGRRSPVRPVQRRAVPRSGRVRDTGRRDNRPIVRSDAGSARGDLARRIRAAHAQQPEDRVPRGPLVPARRPRRATALLSSSPANRRSVAISASYSCRPVAPVGPSII